MNRPAFEFHYRAWRVWYAAARLLGWMLTGVTRRQLAHLYKASDAWAAGRLNGEDWACTRH